MTTARLHFATPILLGLGSVACVDSSKEDANAIVQVEIEPGTPTLRVGAKQIFRAKVTHRDGLEVSQEVEWNFPGLAGVVVPLDELKTTVELIGSAIPGPYPLQARSVEFPDAVQTLTVQMNPLSFSFPSVIQLPGQDQQQVFGDLAFGGPDDAGKLHVFVGFVRPGSENFIRRYALKDLDTYNPQNPPTPEFEYSDQDHPVFYVPASYPVDPPQAVRVAGDRHGNGYWLEPGPQPNDTRSADHVNTILRIMADSSIESSSCAGLCTIDLNSDIAIDSLDRLYVLARLTPTTFAILRIDDAFSDAASAHVVVDDLTVTPRFAVDNGDRLLVLLTHSLRRYQPSATQSGAPYDIDASFISPTFVTPTDVDTDASGLIYVATRELINDQGTDSSDNVSSIRVINELGDPVWSLCQLVDPITGDGADLNKMQRVLSFAVDATGCLFLFDEVNWPDDPTGDGNSSADVVRIDPAVAQGGETSDACDE